MPTVSAVGYLTVLIWLAAHATASAAKAWAILQLIEFLTLSSRFEIATLWPKVSASDRTKQRSADLRAKAAREVLLRLPLVGQTGR